MRSLFKGIATARALGALALVISQAAFATPSVPGNVVVSNVTNSGFTVKWSPSTEVGGTIASYQVWFGNTSQSVSAPTTTYTFTNLPTNTQRYLDVRALDTQGNWSALSQAVLVTVSADTTPPTTPTKFVVSNIQPHQFTVKWNPSTDDTGVVGYEVWMGNTAVELPATATQYTFSAKENVVPGTAYSLAVRARDAAGNFSQLASSSVHTAPFYLRGEDYTEVYANASTVPNFAKVFHEIYAMGGNSVRVFVDIPAPVNGVFSLSDSDTANFANVLKSIMSAAEAEDQEVATHTSSSDARGHFTTVVVLAFKPGGFNDTYWPSESADLSVLTPAEQSMIAIWKTAAGDTLGRGPQVWFDLANEPTPSVNGVAYAHDANAAAAWKTLATGMAQAIRAIDPSRGLVVEPAPWGLPTSMKYQVPLALNNVVYSIHFYTPHSFTHQQFGTTPYSYPPNGVDSAGNAVVDPAAGGLTYNAEIGNDLAAVDAWVNQYGYPIYVGEFSAVRWAPNQSAYNWLQYVLKQFEARNWSWNYHQYKGADDWAADIPSVLSLSSPPPSTMPEPTDLLQQFSASDIVNNWSKVANPQTGATNYSNWIMYFSCFRTTFATTNNSYCQTPSVNLLQSNLLFNLTSQ